MLCVCSLSWVPTSRQNNEARRPPTQTRSRDDGRVANHRKRPFTPQAFWYAVVRTKGLRLSGVCVPAALLPLPHHRGDCVLVAQLFDRGRKAIIQGLHVHAITNLPSGCCAQRGPLKIEVSLAGCDCLGPAGVTFDFNFPTWLGASKHSSTLDKHHVNDGSEMEMMVHTHRGSFVGATICECGGRGMKMCEDAVLGRPDDAWSVFRNCIIHGRPLRLLAAVTATTE